MNEIQFFVSRETGEKMHVDPQEWMEEGKIHPYGATAIELAETMRRIPASCWDFRGLGCRSRVSGA